MSDARADRHASSNLHQLVARAHARYLASTRALPTTPVGAPVPAPLAPRARPCRRAAGWPNSVSHTKEKGGRACALAPANGRALAFVDDKLKHVHSPPPASSLYTRHYWPHVYYACMPLLWHLGISGSFQGLFPKPLLDAGMTVSSGFIF